MVERPGLSKAETEVARIVWDAGQATVREVHERLQVDRSVEFSTVQTYLRRLEQKGYLKVKMEGRTRVYSPRVRPQTVIRETVDDLVDRLFGGDSLPLMMHLIEERSADVEQLAELRAMIDRLQGDENAKGGRS